MNRFHEDILAGIPAVLPEPKPYDTTVSHAPKRKEILSDSEKVLAIKNALRYFPQEHHAMLAEEFAQELKDIFANAVIAKDGQAATLQFQEERKG